MYAPVCHNNNLPLPSAYSLLDLDLHCEESAKKLVFYFLRLIISIFILILNFGDWFPSQSTKSPNPAFSPQQAMSNKIF